uniref:Ig-like domain-containing protein n=1 Tax=Syphacia muris TaxID=451379 RepID=A0A0N5ATA7_9BILA
MGRHLMLDCQAMKEVEDNGYSTLKVVWIWRGFKGKGRIEKQNNVRQKKTTSELTKSSCYRRMYEVNGQLIIYAVQSENEGWYDCHVYANDTREWVSRHYLNVQDCRLVGNATLSLNPRNPCKYGQCTIRNYFTPVNYSYLHCKCIRQFTGEFCHKSL